MYTPTQPLLTHSYIIFNGQKFPTSSNCILNSVIQEPINHEYKPPSTRLTLQYQAVCIVWLSPACAHCVFSGI